MTLTLGDVKNQILAETARDSANYGGFVQNSILSAIVFMETECPYIFEKTSTITISQGSNAANLPADFNQPVYVYYELDGSLYGTRQGFNSINYADLIRLFNSTNDVGNPSKYSFFSNQLYIYPYTQGDITFTLAYNYKDSSYPQVDADTSIWFSNQTLDCIKAKATELFYTYPLQTPEKGAAYAQSFEMFLQNLRNRNNLKRKTNLLSI